MNWTKLATLAEPVVNFVQVHSWAVYLTGAALIFVAGNIWVWTRKGGKYELDELENDRFSVLFFAIAWPLLLPVAAITGALFVIYLVMVVLVPKAFCSGLDLGAQGWKSGYKRWQDMRTRIRERAKQKQPVPAPPAVQDQGPYRTAQSVTPAPYYCVACDRQIWDSDHDKVHGSMHYMMFLFERYFAREINYSELQEHIMKHAKWNGLVKNEDSM